MGGNKRIKYPAHPSLYFCNILRGYEDGWVEFMDKKKAREVAAMLNGQPLGSKNRGFYEHDLWTIKCAASPLLPAAASCMLACGQSADDLQILVQVQVAALDRCDPPSPHLHPPFSPSPRALPHRCFPHFTEKLAYDREVQRQREQAELMQGKKERDAYVAAVHKVRGDVYTFFTWNSPLAGARF